MRHRPVQPRTENLWGRPTGLIVRTAGRRTLLRESLYCSFRYAAGFRTAPPLTMAILPESPARRGIPDLGGGKYPAVRCVSWSAPMWRKTPAGGTHRLARNPQAVRTILHRKLRAAAAAEAFRLGAFCCHCAMAATDARSCGILGMLEAGDGTSNNRQPAAKHTALWGIPRVGAGSLRADCRTLYCATRHLPTGLDHFGGASTKVPKL